MLSTNFQDICRILLRIHLSSSSTTTILSHVRTAAAALSNIPAIHCVIQQFMSGIALTNCVDSTHANAVDDTIGTLSVPLWELLHQRAARRASGSVSQLSRLRFEDLPLQGVETGTITFEVSFELKFDFGLLPGTPVHASAAQALRRPPPADALVLERFRDKILLFLGHRCFLWIAICWLIALCGFGAFCAITFGALYIPLAIVMARGNATEAGANWNAIGLRDEALEWWANVCVQILTGLFTYFNILTLPWRLSILWHMVGKRSDAPGRDFYGRPTDAIWFHIPRKPRAVIILSLIASTTSHMATQASRVVYPSYELAGAMPGVLVCNLTFGLAMLLGIFAGVVQGIEERRLRKAQPERYPPTLVDHFLTLRRKGGFSWLQLICCRLDLLRKSHTEERTRWFIEKELSKLPHMFGASSFRIRSSETHGKGCSKTADAHHRDGTSVSSVLSSRIRNTHGQLRSTWKPTTARCVDPQTAVTSPPTAPPISTSAGASAGASAGSSAGSGAGAGAGTKTGPGPVLGHGPNTRAPMPALPQLLAHQAQRRQMLFSTDGGLNLPGAAQLPSLCQAKPRTDRHGDMPLQLLPLNSLSPIGMQTRLQGPAGEALARERLARQGDPAARLIARLVERDKQLESQSATTADLKTHLAQLPAGSARASPLLTVTSRDVNVVAAIESA